jgi:glycosyltransferase involved in cell wall biosynthesis
LIIVILILKEINRSVINNSKISIIIPTYNRAKIISKAIKSCLEQTYNSIEIIIIDDCSNDNTKEVNLKWVK